ncbi:MAG: hypothetical protein L0Y56_06250 [Nitrospira sp.]|nr:hypothetical protein [Nitrospira sp.]
MSTELTELDVDVFYVEKPMPTTYGPCVPEKRSTLLPVAKIGIPTDRPKGITMRFDLRHCLIMREGRIVSQYLAQNPDEIKEKILKRWYAAIAQAEDQSTFYHVLRYIEERCEVSIFLNTLPVNIEIPERAERETILDLDEMDMDVLDFALCYAPYHILAESGTTGSTQELSDKARDLCRRIRG